MIIYIYIIARCRQGQPVKETLMSQSQCHVFMLLQVLKVKQSYLSVGHLGQRNSIRCWAIYYQRWLHIADPISIELIDVRVNFLIWWISRLIGIWCSGPVLAIILWNISMQHTKIIIVLLFFQVINQQFYTHCQKDLMWKHAMESSKIRWSWSKILC